jgi:hypothetical protein
MRKTIEISRLKEKANYFFVNSPNDSRQIRESLFTFVSGFLHETGNYKGFGYLSKNKSLPGNSFGVEYVNEKVIFPDDSRVFFY